MPKPADSGDVQPWKLLRSSIAFDNAHLRVRRDTVQLPSGKVVDDYFVWESPRIVEVVPITTAGEFVLVRQYRHAVNKIFCQYPAGAVDKGETPEQAAARELEEETGYQAGNLIRLGSLSPYGTKLTGPMDVYLALGATPTGQRHFDEQEVTAVVLMTIEELLASTDTTDLQAMDLLAGTFLAKRYLEKNNDKRA